MDYLIDIKPLEDQGMTDAEIASLLSASTSRDIQISELENFLDFEGLASRNAITGSWEGPLPSEIVNNNFGLSAGLSKLFNHINKPRSVIVDTTVSPWATDALALTGGLLAAGLINQQQYDGFYDLAGGRPNANTVEQDIIDSRAQWEADEAQRQAEEAARQAHQDWVSSYWTQHNSTVAPVLDAGTVDDVALVAALRSLADTIEGA